MTNPGGRVRGKLAAGQPWASLGRVRASLPSCQEADASGQSAAEYVAARKRPTALEEIVMKTLLAAAVAAFALPAMAFAALPVGAAAPDFATKASLAGKEFNFSLDAALKKGPVVLYFFPAAFTSGCTVEAHEFAEATEEFNKLGATIIGVTAGNIDRINEFSVSECRNKFAVAADPNLAIAKSYDSTLALKPGWSNRTSYVITPDHKIAYAYSDLKPDNHVKNTLDAVKAWKTSHGK